MYVDVIVSSIMYFIIASLIFLYGVYYLMKIKRYDKLEALCINYFVHRNYFYRMGTFEYYYYGRKYISREKHFSSSILLKKNKSYTIYVNPDNPEELLTEFDFRFGVYCIIFSIVIVIFNILL